MSGKRIRLWDLPTRLFHWLLVACVAGAVVTGKMGGNLIDRHGTIGLLVVGLLAFRFVWGVTGSTYARFTQYMPTPARIAAYLRGEAQTEGHNPIGALSVFALIGLLTAQALSGLASNDDIAFFGPLYDLAGQTLSKRLTALHHVVGNGLLILVALHVAAIFFYAIRKKRNLVRPMITGWKDDGTGESATGGGLVPFVVAVAIAVAAVYAASGAWLPPALPSSVDTPRW